MHDTNGLDPKTELEHARRADAAMLPGRTVTSYVVQYYYAPWHGDVWYYVAESKTEAEAREIVRIARIGDKRKGLEARYRIVARTDTVIHEVNP